MNQGYKIHLGPVEIPTELQENMLSAHKALAEKRAHIGRIKAGQRDMEREIAEACTELDAAKKSHIAGFAGFAEGATELPAESKKAKAKIAEIGGRILGLEETLPDFAEAIRDAQDVAAIYIMAQRTVAIDPEGYMESAWRMVHAASGEAELVSLYEVWCKLEATVEASDTGDTTLAAMCDVGRGIEDRIVAIPATTARGLAIKVDVGRHHDKGSVMEQSLAADLAALTDNPVHPE